MDYPRFFFEGLAVALHWSHIPIFVLQAIIDQENRDHSVRKLLSKKDEVYVFLTTAELKAIWAVVKCITGVLIFYSSVFVNLWGPEIP